MAWNVAPLEGKVASKPLITTEKPKISIMLPHRGNWHAEFVEATWKPLSVAQLPWCDKSIRLCRVPSLPNARNTLVKQFLAGEDEYCLWVDDDMIVETPARKVGENEIGDPNLALHVLYTALKDSGESIVTGLYRAKQKHGFNYAIWNEKELPTCNKCNLAFPNKKHPHIPPINSSCPVCNKGIIFTDIKFEHIRKWNPPEANWFSVSVCGLGFCLMHRRVFEAMRDAGYGTNEKPYFHWEHPGSRSEDFDMLMKARDLGYKTWCLTDVKLSHMGWLVLTIGEGDELGLRVPKV